MSKPEHGPGLPEIERDYAAVKWRHVPGILAAIHDEVRALNDRDADLDRFYASRQAARAGLSKFAAKRLQK